MSEQDKPQDYAKRQYMASRCTGQIKQITDHEIIDCRVRAFMDGVDWARRKQVRDRALKKRSSKVQS